YSPAEFIPGAKYYQGTRSPIDKDRELHGYSLAWMHHKGRNKHHFEYWTDINPETKRYEPVEMPFNYVVEMFCDRVAACKIYRGADYCDGDALNYFLKNRARDTMNENTASILEKLLRLLAEKGEDEAFREIRLLMGEFRKTR
ncbi:MAG: DUF5662 family protein, partial [Clostridia bacterium]|nr:DUF5662 family protein [Clostridia bacterium]